MKMKRPEIKRYSVFKTCECESMVILERDKSPEHGEWVKYDDIESYADHLEEENRKLRDIINKLYKCRHEPDKVAMYNMITHKYLKELTNE